MKKISILLIILVAITIQFISAEDYYNQYYDTLGTFKQNQCLNLVQTCPNCSFINISAVLYPNSTQILGQVEMTKQGTFYYYNFYV